MLYSIIQKMSSDEVRNFRLQMERVSREWDKKTISLFDFYRGAKTKPTTNMTVLAVYGEDNNSARNNLYSIRRRVLREIKRSLLHQYFEIDHEQQALNEFSYAKIERKKGNLDLCKSALYACLKIARKYDLFEIIELAYKELLNLAPDDQSIDPEALIALRTKNLEKMDRIRASHNKIASVIHQLRKSNFSQGNIEVLEVLEEVRNDSIEQGAFYHSSRGRIRLFNLTSGILLKQQAFGQLEKYLKDEFRFFEENKLFDKNTHRTKIIMLSWLVNATYKNKRFDESLEFCFQMREAMEAYGRRFYTSFVGPLFNSFVNNYVWLDRLDDALTIQTDLIAREEANLTGNTRVFIYLNLASIYFYKQDFRSALLVLSKIQIMEANSMVSASMVLQIRLFELVLRFHEEDFEFLESQIQKLRQNCSDTLAEQSEMAVFLDAFEKINHAKLYSSEEEFRKVLHVEADANPAPFASQGNVIDFGLWLESQLKQKDYHTLRIGSLSG